MAPAVATGGAHEPLNLALGEVLAWPTLRHCYIYCRWRLLERVQIFYGFGPSDKINCYN